MDCVSQVVGNSLHCLQLDRNLWRVYLSDSASRQKLLTEGIHIQNVSVAFIDTNPFSSGNYSTSEKTLKNRLWDHRFLKFWFNIDDTKRGPGYWKLNISYFENERYKIGISNSIQNIDLSLDPITLWETIKQKAKESSITFAKMNKNQLSK